MTTVVILLLGGAYVLGISAFESNADGSDVSVLQTVIDIWNGDVKTASSNANPTSGTAQPSGTQPLSSNAGPTSQIQSSTL